MTGLRILLAATFAAGACLSGAGVAHADDRGLPVGTWITTDLKKELLVSADGHCTLKPGKAQLDVAGPCTWEAYHLGGTLTIFSDSPALPDPVSYPVLWIGDTMIQVTNDVFALRT